jgi:hypothetical protein
MNNSADMQSLERRLLEAGRNLTYPRTPDLARTFLRRSHQVAPQWRRWAFALVILLTAIAALLAVPEVRARVLEFLQIGAVHIEAPVPQETQENKEWLYGRLISFSALGGETTLDEARVTVDFSIPLPTYPADLGTPDHVYVQHMEPERYFVILTWVEEQDDSEVRLALYVIGPGVSITKGPVDQIQVVEVNGQPAAYVRGAHFLRLDSREDYGVLVQAPALIWESDGITYRIEADLSIEELVRIAESLNK